ncbi:Prephenate dehydratase [uncultured archaeon]|nr:Prephenate dehydratase [uncultured archaeon]
MKIAYLGPKGTYTGEVARNLFPDKELVSLNSIRSVVIAVEEGKVDYGVVPLENFYNGEVRETFDSLIECSKTRIVQESSLEIIHCIGALKGHGDIKNIFSKDQALEQSGKYLLKFYPNSQTIAVSSTSEAASKIREGNILDSAAIASEKSLKEFGLEILDSDICPNNKTRFAVLGRDSPLATGKDKTFLVIHPPYRDRPGILNNILSFFAGFGINLESIQSRPDGKNGYYFYVELNGHEQEPKIQKSIDAIRFSLDPEFKHNDTIRILGSFKDTNWKG